MPNAFSVHQTAAQAWEALLAHGGLEPAGRDREFVDKLLSLLAPQADDIDTALTNSSTDRFVQCFFQSMQQFTEMFRAILDYYQAAGARRGRQQLNISIEEAHLEFKDFEDFIQLWNDVPGDLEVPLVDQSTMSVHRVAFEAVPGLPSKTYKAVRGEICTGDPQVDAWLERYRDGHFSPVPPSLWLEQQQHGYKQLAAIGVAAVETILEIATSRSELWEHVPAARIEECDSFSVAHLRLLETDSWLGTMVAGLALARDLDEDERDRIGDILIDRLAGLPLRKIRTQVSFGDLQKFLSLPVWKKRHELYAVWIFTELLEAADHHDLRLHHDNGRITFQFRETLLASIVSARPNLDMITERKTPLDDPVGKGRTGNVQPDYSVWENGRLANKRCILVVEVKHYKRTANRSFADVLTDYAAAHPDAKVVLVNYGPIGDILDRLPFTAKWRCSVVENLTPLSALERERFRYIVRGVLGEPYRPAPAVDQSRHARTAIAVDVSGSMSEVLTDPKLEQVIATLAVGPVANELYPIDSRIHDPIPIDQSSRLAQLARDINSLAIPVSQLLGTYEKIFVLTDHDGLRDLADLGGVVEALPLTGMFKVSICQ
ncbi:hypothetical protein [Sinorhizobium meliloti]|uniref:hypothetical protein n=1 Tax=Rhizobium meliloti TaxID=382 RepID=UPI003F188F89